MGTKVFGISCGDVDGKLVNHCAHKISRLYQRMENMTGDSRENTMLLLVIYGNFLKGNIKQKLMIDK